MIRNLLPWTAGCLLAAFSVSSCESDDVDYGPISAAIEIGVEEVTPSSAKIRLTTEQENVASYKIVKPTPISEFEYAAHDAIDRLAFIEERGEAAEAPFEQTLAGLMPKVEYSFAVVGLDASGQRITAPTFARFTTAYASSLVEARFETNPDETFTFTGKITPNAYTVSYRYIFDSDHNEATEAELRELLEAGGSGVKTDKGVKELELVKSDKTGVTLAVLSYDDANRPGEFTSTFVSTEDMASVIVDGKETQLARPTEGVDIFEGKVAVPAKSGFTVEINKVAYGFAPYSGNGGVGTVNNDRACVPFYTYPAAEYYVRRSLGRMASDPLNKFWINLTADARIDLRIDCTQDPFRYDLQLVEADDPALILAQYFDLMVYGGDWIQTGKNAKSGRMGQSTDTALIDGTEPGEKEASYTTFGAKIASEGEASPAYLANRGLTGWGIAHCFEFPGYIRLSNTANSSGNMYGILTTPKLTALSGPTSITLTFDAVRFASTSDIPVKVLGAGTIKTASVRIEEGTAETAITPAADGQSIAITSTHCPKHANDDFKKWSCFTLTIDGATAETQIRWDTTGVGAESKDGRICLDNIAIRKN